MTPERRRRAHATVVVAALLLAVAPRAADATVIECGRDASCGNDFVPSFTADASSYNETPALQGAATIRTPASITFTHGAIDRKTQVVTADYLIPRGWRFAASQIHNESPALDANGAPASSCEQVYNTGSPRRIARAEVISADAIVKGFVNGELGEPARVPVEWRQAGRRNNRSQSSIALLRWNDTTATADLCVHLVSNNSSQISDASARDIIIPAQLARISGDPAYGWRFRVDLSPLYRHPALRQLELGVVLATFSLNSYSAGNHHRNPYTGALERIAFSRAMDDPGTHRVAARLSGCLQGLAPAGAASLCVGDVVGVVTREARIAVTLPPRGPRLDHGMLTGPLGLGTGMGTFGSTAPQYQGFGFIHGTDTATITWAQPALPPDTTIKGYVVTVTRTARPSVRWSKRVIVDPARAGFDAAACGPDGAASSCKISLRFPLRIDANRTLYGDRRAGDDGMYDIALVTIYGSIYRDASTVLDDGRRSDGRCDDGTADGTICDPTVAPPVLRAPGVSFWRFMMRARKWPLTYLQRGTYSPTPEGNTRACSSCAPHALLLADLEAGALEFVLWTAATGGTTIGEPGLVPAGFYDGSGGLLRGTNDRGGGAAWADSIEPINFQAAMTAQEARLSASMFGSSTRMVTFSMPRFS